MFQHEALAMILPPTICGLFTHLIILSMFTLAYSIQLHQQPDIADNGWEVSKFHLEFNPPSITWLTIGEFKDVYINCSTCSTFATTLGAAKSATSMDMVVDAPHLSSSTAVTGLSTSHQYLNATHMAKSSTQIVNNLTYIAWIMSKNAKIAIPVGADHIVRPYSNRTDQILLSIHPNSNSVFSVSAIYVGHAILLIRVYPYSGDINWSDDVIDEQLFATLDTLSIMEYPVTVVRRDRVVDRAYNIVIAAVAILNSFSTGCVTDWASLRMHIQHPSALLIGISCQFILNPIVSMQ